MNTPPLILAPAASALAIGILTLTGCSTAPSPDIKKSYSTFDEAQEVSSRLPGLLPTDATTIKLVARASGKGAVLKFDSSVGITAEYCRAGPLDGSPTDLDVDWWPDTIPADGYDCSRWMVFETDGSYYAWDTTD